MALTICGLRDKLNVYILEPLFLLLFTLGFLVFVWGVVEFLWGLNAGSREEGKENGKRHMLWGIVGMFIMFAAYAIVSLIADSVDRGVLYRALNCPEF